MKTEEDACLGLCEDPVEDEGVEVNVQVEAPAEALDDSDASGLPVQDPALARPLAQRELKPLIQRAFLATDYPP